LTPSWTPDRDADYVTAVKKAANAALRKGYLMKADRDAYLAEAKEADVPG
jgi:hypothetical protein